MAALKMVSSNGVPTPKIRRPKFHEGQDVVLKGSAQDIMTVERRADRITRWHDIWHVAFGRWHYSA